MARHGFFSERQQAVLVRMHGSPEHVRASALEGVGDYAIKPHRALVAHVFEGADPAEIVVATSVQDDATPPAFPDTLDLGPVGRHLHAFPADAPYPTQAMVLPRDRFSDLLGMRLGPAEVAEAAERARERCAPPASPAP